MKFYKNAFPVSYDLIRALGNGLAWFGKGKERFCIVNYHRVLEHLDPLLESEPDVTIFRWQMKLLASSFNVLPLHDALLAMEQGRLPPRAICITFDDGYRSIHDLALPILKEFNLPATVFITTGHLGEANMWNDRIIESVRHLHEGQLDLQDVGLGVHSLDTLQDRKNIVDKLTDDSKYLPPHARQAVILKLESLRGIAPVKGLMLTRDMVSRLANEGIEIGAHTITHPILTSLEDESARHEIFHGKNQLEAIIGKPVRLFAYPNGKAGMDFDARHVSMARDAGYTAAFTTAIGAATKKHDLYQLPRSRPWDATPFMFALRLLRWLATEGTPQKNPAPVKRITAATDAPQRALLIAFHFPPQSASSGIQRTLSFAKNLGNHHWEPLVISANPMAYEQKNSSQLASLPSSLIVRRAFALDAKRHMGISGRYPEFFALPDRWISWWSGAVPTGLALVRRYKPQVIWSTFPIATSHLIGLTLHRLTGLPWIADFRDPMMQKSYPSSKWQRKAFAWIERQTINRCVRAVFTTESALNAYKQRFPAALHDKFIVIENGYDEDGFNGFDTVQTATAPKADKRITLLHSGVLYTEGRDPGAFFQAIQALKTQGKLSHATLRVILRAPGEIPHFQALVERYDIGDIVDIASPVPYQEALREMLAADGLIIFQGTPFNTQIPAKIYEYFRARKPVFGLLDPSGETARVLTAAGFNDIAAMTSVDAIIPALEKFITNIQKGDAYIASDAVIDASSRKHRAKQLAQVFSDVTGCQNEAVFNIPEHQR